MKYFLCPEDPDCIPVIEAENIDEAKKEMCTACIEAPPEDFECDDPLEVTDGSEDERPCQAMRCLIAYSDGEGGCYWVEEDLCSSCAMLLNNDAVHSVLEERMRQVKKYGFDAEHDDQNTQEELRWAAHSYLSDSSFYWPSQWKNWKYRGEKDTYRQRLVTAAALLLAEIERVDRRIDRGVHGRI